MDTTNTTQSANWRLLHYFNFYRLAIASVALLFGLGFAGSSWGPFGSTDDRLFLIASLTYAIICAMAVAASHQQQPEFDTQANVMAFGDITFLTLLIHASGGLDSGLGFFLVVAIIGASLMLARRMILLFAALAAIAVLLQHSWPWLTGAQGLNSQLAQGYSQVGILGIVIFLTATLGHALALRLRHSEALAERRGEDIVGLTELNELIIQNLQSGVLVCDAIGRIQTLNQKAKHFLGLSSVEAQTSLGQVSPELFTALNDWRSFPASPTQRPFRSSEGPMLVPRFVPLDQDKAMLIFLDDVSVLKQQAQQLKMAALARLTASIAHEIRNPLGAISNAAQLLAESIPAPNPDARLIQIIEDHCRRMNVIIENITQLSRRDRVNQSTLPLDEWLQDFRRQFADINQIDSNSFAISGIPHLDVCVDGDQLYQVVTNLCQNALRHSPPYEGKPVIELRLGRDEQARPCLDVIDTGPGIPPEIAENIFDPFFTTAAQGTGLGLYISRELCEGNGGNLSYLAHEAPGACFRITFAPATDCENI